MVSAIAMSFGTAASCFVLSTISCSFLEMLTLIRTLLMVRHISAAYVNSCPNVTKIFPGHPKQSIFSKCSTEKLLDIWMLFPDWMIVVPLMVCPWITQLHKLEIFHSPDPM